MHLWTEAENRGDDEVNQPTRTRAQSHVEVELTIRVPIGVARQLEKATAWASLGLRGNPPSVELMAAEWLTQHAEELAQQESVRFRRT
jgi:hypothetical protein